MTDPIRTPAEALEAAAQIAENAYFDSGASIPGGFVADSIRALDSRIPPAPDDEVLARLVEASEAPAGNDGLGETRVRVSDLRDVLAARIAAPDGEALVETVAQALWEHGAMSFAPWCEANALERQGYVAEARAVLAALREAGALRHE